MALSRAVRTPFIVILSQSVIRVGAALARTLTRTRAPGSPLLPSGDGRQVLQSDCTLM
jgi:hypothetical protein